MERSVVRPDTLPMGKKRKRIVLGPPKRHYIKEWRKHRDMTQEKLGAKLGRSASHISQIERGTLNYTRETLEALAYALSCEPSDLLGVDPERPRSELAKIVEKLSPEQEVQAARVIKALVDHAT